MPSAHRWKRWVAEALHLVQSPLLLWVPSRHALCPGLGCLPPACCGGSSAGKGSDLVTVSRAVGWAVWKLSEEQSWESVWEACR